MPIYHFPLYPEVYAIRAEFDNLASVPMLTLLRLPACVRRRSSLMMTELNAQYSDRQDPQCLNDAADILVMREQALSNIQKELDRRRAS